MTKRYDWVIRKLVLLSACSLLPFGGMAVAQDAEQKAPTATQSIAPLFDMNPVYDDGVMRLVRANGDALTLQRKGDKALLSFDGDPEIWAMTITPGPANSELFKNDAERLFLRLSDRGNLSLYTPDYPGEPVELDEASDKITPPEVQGDDFEMRLSTYLSLRVGQDIKVEIDSPGADALPWMQDAAAIAVKGMVKSKDRVQTIKRVRIIPANVPDFRLSEDGIFTVYVDPETGFEGRSSSDRVILFLRGNYQS